jgi:hypothetical protein
VKPVAATSATGRLWLWKDTADVVGAWSCISRVAYVLEYVISNCIGRVCMIAIVYVLELGTT